MRKYTMKVFLSYAYADELLARRIAEGLKEAGFDVWYDRSEILPGENWADKISRALRESEAMVVLITPESLRSPNVQWEIGYALGDKSYKKRLIPVVVGSPDNLPTEGLPWILQRLQMIRLPKRGKQDAGIKRIAQTLRDAA